MQQFPTQPKKPQKQYANDSVVESLRNIGSGVGNAVVKDVINQSASDAFAALLGNYKPQEQYQNRMPVQPKVPERPMERAPQPVIRKPEIMVSQEQIRRDQEAVTKQINSVRIELKQLALTLKSLNTEVEKAINDAPIDAGVYHQNFFERLRSLITLMRKQVNEGRSWLNLFQSRKKSRGYWKMYKKHGTSFGLSSERSTATQAG